MAFYPLPLRRCIHCVWFLPQGEGSPVGECLDRGELTLAERPRRCHGFKFITFLTRTGEIKSNELDFADVSQNGSTGGFGSCSASTTATNSHMWEKSGGFE